MRYSAAMASEKDDSTEFDGLARRYLDLWQNQLSGIAGDQALADGPDPAPTSGPDPDLIVVPVGVGSLAQAVVTHYRRPGRRRPRVLSGEPDTAA